MTISHLIDSLRPLEDRADYELIEHSDAARRLLRAWPRVRRTLAAGALPDDPAEALAAAWRGCRYDPGEWAALADVAPSEVERFGALLRGNALVYPDGSINAAVASVAKAAMAKRLGARGGKG